MPHHKHHHHHHSTAAAVASGLGKALYFGALVAVEVADAAAEQRRREQATRQQLAYENLIATQARQTGYQQAQYDLQRREEYRKQREQEEAKKLEVKTQVEDIILEATKIIHGQLGVLRNVGSYLGLIDTFKEAHTKLNTAESLAKQIDYYDGLSRIKVLNAKLSWLEFKPEFMQTYELLLQRVKQQVFSRELMNAIDEHIKIYKTRNLSPSADEADILASLNQALKTVKTFVVRAEDKEKNIKSEAMIKQHIIDAEAQMKLGAFSRAAKYLRDARALARSINYVEDISCQEYTQSDFFEASIQLLTNAQYEFETRAALYSKQYANKTIDKALAKWTQTSNNTLLGRHRKRLEDGISQEFAQQWVQFDRKSEKELDDLFTQIQDMIFAELRPVTLKKTLGTAKQNGIFGIDQAGLFLENSKGTTPAIRELIRKYRSTTLFYLDIPVFRVRQSHSAVFTPFENALSALSGLVPPTTAPVALAAELVEGEDTADVPVAVEALDSLQDANYSRPTPSAPPMIF